MFDSKNLRVDCSDNSAELLKIEAEARFDDLVVIVDGVAYEYDWTEIAKFVPTGEDVVKHSPCFIDVDESCPAKLEGLWISFAEVSVDKVGMRFDADVVIFHAREDIPHRGRNGL